MKLYENKVGRPSNETLKKRRNFSLVITLGVLLLIGATTLTVTKLSTNGLKGSASGKPTVVYTSSQTVYEYKAHPASYKITNSTGKTLYYRWFTYADSNYNGKATYVQPVCSSLAKGKTYTTKPTITLSAKNPTRAGKLRLYSTSSACSSDKKGTSTSSKIYGTYVTTIKYQSLASALSITATASQSYKSYGTYPVAITLNNETGKTYYYRWFTYNTSNASGNPSYYDKTCGSYSSKRTSNPTLKIDESNPYRSGKMKVYKTAASCGSDTSGTASNSNVINSKVVNVNYAGAVKEPNKVVETGNACGDKVIYNATKYSLTESQIIKLAKMVYAEYSADIAGMKAVASHMANLYESRYSSRSAQGLYNYITTTEWYAARTKSNNNYNQNAVNAVKQCIVNGQRTLPTYIDEFDMFPGDIKNPLSKSNYVRGQTKVNNKYGSSGTFWCFSSSSYGTNIFFYTKK